jgi:SAM-dependent methyltransferase
MARTKPWEVGTAANLYTSDEYSRQVSDWHVSESNAKVREILRALHRHRLTPRRVCDVGCGAGEVLRLLQQQLPTTTEFVGYDIAPRALELAASRANARLRFIQGDMPRDVHDDFDLLLALDVIEHVEDYFGFLRALRPISKYKIFFFPLDLSVQTVIRPYGLLQKRDAYGHLHYFTRETALRALTDVGYTIVDSVYTSDMIDMPTHLLGRKVLKYPRKLLFALSPDFAVHLLGGYRLLVLAR